MESTVLCVMLIALWMTTVHGGLAPIDRVEVDQNSRHLRTPFGSGYLQCLMSCTQEALPDLNRLQTQPCTAFKVTFGIGFYCPVKCGNKFRNDPFSPCVNGCSFDQKCLSNVTLLGVPITSVNEVFDASKINEMLTGECLTSCKDIKDVTESVIEVEDSNEGNPALAWGLALGLGIPILLMAGYCYHKYSRAKRSTAGTGAQELPPQYAPKHHTFSGVRFGENQNAAHLQRA